MNQNFTIKKVFFLDEKRLFDYFQNADLLKRWLSIKKCAATDIDIDFHVGGRYSITSSIDRANSFTLSGEYRAIVANSLIEFSFNSEDVKDTIVRMEFVPVEAGKCRVDVSHSSFPNTQTMLEYKAFWIECLSHLEELISNPGYCIPEDTSYVETGSYY